jgi:hypothetical protein
MVTYFNVFSLGFVTQTQRMVAKTKLYLTKPHISNRNSDLTVAANFLILKTLYTKLCGISKQMASTAIVRAYETLEGTVRNDADALVIAVHACLHTEGFRLVSVGDDVPNNSAKELAKIPSKWNEAEEVYALSYRHDKSPGIFLFKLLVVDDVMILHCASDRTEDLHILELRQVHNLVCDVDRRLKMSSDWQIMYSILLRMLLQTNTPRYGGMDSASLRSIAFCLTPKFSRCTQMQNSCFGL